VGLVLLMGLGLGTVYVLSQQQPTVASGLKRVVVSADAARSFDMKVKALEDAALQAKATGRSAPVQATFTEEELTSAVNAAAGSSTGPLAASDTQIHLSGGNVIATSNVTVQGFTLPVGIVATPTVSNGQVSMVVQQIQTGGLPLPDVVTQQIQSQLAREIDPATLGLPMTISSLQIQNGQLVVSGTTQP
jgi:DUF2993 family protein